MNSARAATAIALLLFASTSAIWLLLDPPIACPVAPNVDFAVWTGGANAGDQLLHCGSLGLVFAKDSQGGQLDQLNACARRVPS